MTFPATHGIHKVFSRNWPWRMKPAERRAHMMENLGRSLVMETWGRDCDMPYPIFVSEPDSGRNALMTSKSFWGRMGLEM